MYAISTAGATCDPATLDPSNKNNVIGLGASFSVIQYSLRKNPTCPTCAFGSTGPSPALTPSKSVASTGQLNTKSTGQLNAQGNRRFSSGIFED